MQSNRTPYRSSSNAITFPIGDREWFTVDDDVAPLVADLPWYLIDDGTPLKRHYVYSTRGLIHRLIMQASTFFIVDHVNDDTMDNRRSNLRLVTHSQSCMNRGKHTAATSRYKGVNWRPDRRKWQARIKVNRRTTFLGFFDTEVEAARAYDEQARQLHGQFARVNFPLPGEVSAHS